VTILTSSNAREFASSPFPGAIVYGRRSVFLGARTMARSEKIDLCLLLAA
jgi:hypothetical protein